jgi:hypothetical protein
MAGIGDIVNVSITTQTSPTKSPGFGTVVIVGPCLWWVGTDRVRSYANVAALVSNGCPESAPEYLAASSLMRQEPQPTKFLIARRANRPTMKFRLTPVAYNSREYTLYVNSKTATITSDATATVPEIVAALKTAIDALGEPVTTALVGTSGAETALDVTANTVGAFVRLCVADSCLSVLNVEQTHADPGLAADLSAILTANSDFYGVMLTTASKAEIAAFAAWIETNKRFSLQASQDSAIVNTVASGATDIAATLKSSSYARTGVVYHPDNAAFVDAAFFGATFPYSPGKIDFKFRNLKGVASVPLDGTQIDNAKAKNANFYTTYGDTAITAEGKNAAGEFIDITRDRDAFAAALQADIFTLRAQTPRLPYTDNGIARLKSTTLAVGQRFTETDNDPNFLVAGSFWINFPRAASVSSTDKGNRKYTARFGGKIAGAIYAVDMVGEITL